MIDAADFLRAPEAHLRRLCGWLGIGFTDRDAALAGRAARQRRRLGAALVRRGVGVDRLRAGAAAEVVLAPEHAAVAEACRPAYEALRERRLRI